MFAILAPIFALIALGYACRRVRVFGPNAYVELNRFVVCLALPALLFDIVAHVTLRQFGQPGFLAAFAIGALVVFALPLVFGRTARPFGDAVLDGLSACYPNTGFIGLPLAFLAFGPASGPGAAIAAVFTTCVLFGAAIALLEWEAHRAHAPSVALLKVVNSLVRNPMVAAPVFAVAFSAGWIALPPAADHFVKLLAGSAGPCALVSLWLFLARDDHSNARQWAQALKPRPLALVALKLVAQPLLTWCVAMFAFSLPSRDTQLVTLMSALPTGTGAFMLADYYKRDPAVTSTVILVSTVASVLSLVALLTAAPYAV